MATIVRAKSRVAHAVASRQEWGKIHSCKQVVPRVWEVSAAGHGGFVLPLSAVKSSTAREALRELRVVSTMVDTGRRMYWDRPGSTWYRDQLPDAEVSEWVVAEEDCDWALVVFAVPGFAEALAERGGMPVEGVVERAAASVRSYREGAVGEVLIAELGM
jgi:hypothetical protein